MKILLAIIHYWDPNGNGRHQSLRSNPAPRVEALNQQLLAFRRLGSQQYQINMVDNGVFRTNELYRHELDIHVITDGHHTVLDQLGADFRSCFTEFVTKPSSGMMLGFEAHNHIASILQDDDQYDLVGYMEDDLIIHDPLFFQKIIWFQNLMGPTQVLLPQRIEMTHRPHFVDRLFIDGPLGISNQYPTKVRKEPPVVMDIAGGKIVIETPLNPHAGCFFLTPNQFYHWMNQPHWLDRDCSFISPLESAATLGILKTFSLRKASFDNASWFELLHYGNSFHLLVQPPHS